MGELLKRTPLFDLHADCGAKFAPFAGYEMPVQFPAGILKEHTQTRNAAGLFDVSHMGQVRIFGTGAAEWLESLVPGDIAGLGPGRMRYTQFTNEAGGILDDLMVTRFGDHLFLIVNAACKTADLDHMKAALPVGVTIEELDDRALIALQGPSASAVLARHSNDGVATMPFMSSTEIAVGGVECIVSRCGYTGEDGFEISTPVDHAIDLAEALLAEAEVGPIGLGARDSLRLEAGLCLYGQDIDATTTPVEADLVWSIGKRRRADGGFPGDTIIQGQIADGATRKRVGVRPTGRAPVRAHSEIIDAAGAGLGEITSGGFGPTVGGPVAMGYVARGSAVVDTPMQVMVRGKALPAKVAKLPFTPQRYYRG
ncbi:MAG: glycine cleavage system aminomethyltransferase GcvT [Rhodospirillaceae bacterium]|nr:glycine cleavage system aminomethyltransferase GcvT [Rhodospirillaceae bacterium]MBT5666240.1 glycine cleavage system aminomethyltransferase GcvT [Rhodospirillaceae bacterium]MBT5810390.1 glycine cleavage system aminomethyltransferase GcvT [Rhodospirillaceae bacterium]